MNCNILHYKGASFQLTSLLNVEIIEIKSAPTVRKYARMVLKDEVKNRNKLKQLENDSTKTVPTSKHTLKNPVNSIWRRKGQTFWPSQSVSNGDVTSGTTTDSGTQKNVNNASVSQKKINISPAGILRTHTNLAQ